MPTFSINVGTMGSHEHNNRSGYIPPHVDKERIKDNVIIEDCNLVDKLHEVFDDELEIYNKGKKPSRRKTIDDIINDKKAIVEREIVGTFGDMQFRKVNGTLQKEMILDYIKNFQERNPNLIVTQNILHVDERGSYHFHTRFIPIYHDTKGLHIKVGMNRALREMVGTDEKQSFDTWRSRELKYAESIMKKHNHKLVEKNESRKHLKKEIYIKQQQIKGYDKAIELKEKKLAKLKDSINNLLTGLKSYLEAKGITNSQFDMFKQIECLKQENKQLKKEVFKHDVLNERMPINLNRERERTL